MDMLRHSEENPVYQVLVRGARWPPLRAALYIALVLGVVTLIFSVVILLSTPRFKGGVLLLLVLFGWIVTLFTPALTATTASRYAHRFRTGEAYPLIRLTGLPPIAMVRGIVFAALFRLRVLLALLLGLMPAQAVGVVYLDLMVESVFYQIQSGTLMYVGNPPPFPEFPPSSVYAASVFTLVALWGMNLLGAALGTALALRFQRAEAAAAVSALAMLILTPGLMWLGLIHTEYASLFCLPPLLMPVPYALAWLVARRSRRWA
jgi:hypothetical protein